MSPRKDDAAALTGAAALHALSAVEQARFEAHLAESEETRNELTELSDTAVLLGLATDPVKPPAALKDSIMARLATTPQLSRLVEDAPSVPLAIGLGEAAAPTGAQAKAQARWFSRPIVALTAAAAAVALIVGGGFVVGTVGTTGQQQAQADQLAAINAASDSRRAVDVTAAGVTATLVWSAQLRSSALIVSGLKPLPADKVYQLWYIDAAGTRPAGLLAVRDSSSVWRVLDGEMAAGDTVGVTVEPLGGSPAPTTKPVLAIAAT